MTASATLAVLYRNHRGEVATRRILPSGIYYGETEWHPGTQWHLRCLDLDRDVWREFALAGVLAIGDEAIAAYQRTTTIPETETTHA